MTIEIKKRFELKSAKYIDRQFFIDEREARVQTDDIFFHLELNVWTFLGQPTLRSCWCCQGNGLGNTLTDRHAMNDAFDRIWPNTWQCEWVGWRTCWAYMVFWDIGYYTKKKRISRNVINRLLETFFDSKQTTAQSINCHHRYPCKLKASNSRIVLVTTTYSGMERGRLELGIHRWSENVHRILGHIPLELQRAKAVIGHFIHCWLSTVLGALFDSKQTIARSNCHEQ